VDDVLGAVVVAVGDEALDALEQPGAVPVGFGQARVRPAPTSLPASGSVRTIEPPQARSMMASTKRAFCASVPRRSMVRATNDPNM
jgi:hypothetical protein